MKIIQQSYVGTVTTGPGSPTRAIKVMSANPRAALQRVHRLARLQGLIDDQQPHELTIVLTPGVHPHQSQLQPPPD